MPSLSLFGSLERLLILFDKYGWEGAKMWRNKKFTKNKLVKYSLKGFRHPIFLRTNTSDFATFQQIFIENQYAYEIEHTPLTILDCGANIGLASVYYADKYPNAKIIAVEPEVNNFNLLKKNTEKYNNIICLRYGIWNKSTNLIIRDANVDSWAFVTKEVEYSNADTIQAISIDDLVEKFEIKKIDILKMDIEGAEKEVFQSNFKNWLHICKLVIIEFHDKVKKNTAHSFFCALNKSEYVFGVNGENVFCEIKRYIPAECDEQIV